MTVDEARLDLQRRQRLGMVEAVWGEHKSAEQIVAILRSMRAAGELALVTRVNPAKAAAV
ncbi:MAG: circadian phase modifier CpmA, partial [Synechococcus sp. BS307-5m-G37]|nr:circadian phase modifier CpmA [Synechococcus sp. BS307-5m-G37]